MTHHVLVRVVNKSGTPLNHERVSLFTTPVNALGAIPDTYTDAEGMATFDLDLDDRSQVIVYVRGRERCSKAPLRDRYDIAV